MITKFQCPHCQAIFEKPRYRYITKSFGVCYIYDQRAWKDDDTFLVSNIPDNFKKGHPKEYTPKEYDLEMLFKCPHCKKLLAKSIEKLKSLRMEMKK